MPAAKIYRRTRLRRSRPALTASLSTGISFPFGELSVTAFQFDSAAALSVPQAQPVIEFPTIR
jgi:hypothetical protein